MDQSTKEKVIECVNVLKDGESTYESLFKACHKLCFFTLNVLCSDKAAHREFNKCISKDLYKGLEIAITRFNERKGLSILVIYVLNIVLRMENHFKRVRAHGLDGFIIKKVCELKDKNVSTNQNEVEKVSQTIACFNELLKDKESKVIKEKEIEVLSSLLKVSENHQKDWSVIEEILIVMVNMSDEYKPANFIKNNEVLEKIGKYELSDSSAQERRLHHIQLIKETIENRLKPSVVDLTLDDEDDEKKDDDGDQCGQSLKIDVKAEGNNSPIAIAARNVNSESTHSSEANLQNVNTNTTNQDINASPMSDCTTTSNVSSSKQTHNHHKSNSGSFNRATNTSANGCSRTFCLYLVLSDEGILEEYLRDPHNHADIFSESSDQIVKSADGIPKEILPILLKSAISDCSNDAATDKYDEPVARFLRNATIHKECLEMLKETTISKAILNLYIRQRGHLNITEHILCVYRNIVQIMNKSEKLLALLVCANAWLDERATEDIGKKAFAAIDIIDRDIAKNQPLNGKDGRLVLEKKEIYTKRKIFERIITYLLKILGEEKNSDAGMTPYYVCMLEEAKTKCNDQHLTRTIGKLISNLERVVNDDEIQTSGPKMQEDSLNTPTSSKRMKNNTQGPSFGKSPDSIMELEERDTEKQKGFNQIDELLIKVKRQVEEVNSLISRSQSVAELSIDSDTCKEIMKNQMEQYAKDIKMHLSNLQKNVDNALNLEQISKTQTSKSSISDIEQRLINIIKKSSDSKTALNLRDISLYFQSQI